MMKYFYAYMIFNLLCGCFFLLLISPEITEACNERRKDKEGR